ncbi:hypothetical protein CHI07_17125 [Paenibacillus sp. 7884-2]|nr:hypothetical protein CHI07_17125 [Paenibacillus sp. 7884-2]
MRLNDPLVTSFIYNGKEYAINLAFDVVLDAFDWLNNKHLRDYEKAEICLNLLINEDVRGVEAFELWNHIYKTFINNERRKPIEYDLKGNPMPVNDEDDEDERHIDFEQDAQYIYASFQQAYSMSLYEQQGKLQWREFYALLHGLPSNTIMQRIIQIRAWKPSKGESEEDKQNMRKLQKVYALNDRDEEEVDE